MYNFTSLHFLYSCQEVILDCMKLGRNIAKNAALRENVFMMLVCISVRIPLFLIGKPGSSKSLAKSIILNSMKGKNSESSLLKEFMEVDNYNLFHYLIQYVIVYAGPDLLLSV